MALYEITQDCRISNIEYQKWDVVSDTEVGGFFPTVMKPTDWQPKQLKKELTEEENVKVEEEVKEEVKVAKKPTKKQSKKK